MDKVASYQEVAKSDTIVVSGKIGEVSTDDLRHHLSKFGKIVNINRQLEREGKFKRFAIVVFDKSEEVDRVVEEHEHIVGGQIVDCKRAKSR
jgi:RNA recognition motif-containing protein